VSAILVSSTATDAATTSSAPKAESAEPRRSGGDDRDPMNTPTDNPGTGTGSEQPSLTWRLLLHDGRVVAVRPVTPEDLTALRDAIEHADAETLRMRFLGGQPPRDEASLHHLVEVDYSTRLALVALDEGCHGVAIARYEGSPGSEIAEAAVTVAPGWRRVGLGTGLLSWVRRQSNTASDDSLPATWPKTKRWRDSLHEAAFHIRPPSAPVSSM
jgi:hypothetical protein